MQQNRDWLHSLPTILDSLDPSMKSISIDNDVTYIYNPEKFDQIWDLVSDDPEWNTLTDEMISLLPREVTIELIRASFERFDKFLPVGSYLLVSRKEPIRVISFTTFMILKHTIGQNPSAWTYAEVGPIPDTPGRGPLYIISDIDILNMGILSLVDNQGRSKNKYLTNEYPTIIRNRYNHNLQLGDMIHIPVYDIYSTDHNDIYYHLLIYDGKELVYPEEGNYYGFVAPKETPFPVFPLEHFAPLGRCGELGDGFRWVTSYIVEQYNNTNVMIRDIYYIKSLNIKGRTYYFAGEKEVYPVEMKKVHIDEDNNLDVDYILVFN